MSQTFEQISTTRDWLLIDGATGINLFHAGLETGYPADLWNVEYPDRVTTLHSSFISAGADVILINSFGFTLFRLKVHQAENSVTVLNLAEAVLARQAADAADKPVLVARSMGPTGELFQPLGAFTADAAEQAFALAEGGVALLWIETMSSLEEVEAAVKGARRINLPVAATMTSDSAGRIMIGVTPAAYTEFATSFGLDAFEANCGVGPAKLLDSVHKFKHGEKNPAFIGKGNFGIPVYVDGKVIIMARLN